MRLGEALAPLGVRESDYSGICVVRPEGEGQGLAHFPLSDVADVEIGEDEWYVASGIFRDGAIQRYKGRSTANVARVLWLPFDFDLADWTRLDRKSIYSYPTAALAPLLNGLRAAVEQAFLTLNLPIHWLVSSGHGLCAGVRIAAEDATNVAELQRLHKALVQRLNQYAAGTFADPQVSDAGPRITRVPWSVNRKGSEPRRVQLLAVREGAVTLNDLRQAVQAPAPIGKAIPATGQTFDAATEDELVVAVQPSWIEGNRHFIALGLAGYLAKAGVPEEQTRRIVERLAASDPELQDRLKAVGTTYERARSGMPVEGYYALRDYVPLSVMQWLEDKTAALIARNRPRVANDYNAPAEIKPIPAKHDDDDDYVPLPDACLVGWIGEYVDLMLPTTEAPACYHYGVGMTLAGATIGRRIGVIYGSDPLYANLYTLLIGRSGRSRKDTAIKRATRIVMEPVQLGPERLVDSGVRVSTDIGSAEGLIRILKDQPNTLLYLSEFARLIQQARRKGTQTILPVLIEAFDTPPVLENLNKADPIEARYPYLSVLSATQPEILAGLMADDDLHSGFANRWFFVAGAGRGPIPNPPTLDRHKAARLYLELWKRINGYAEGTMLRMNEASAERWEAWYRADYARPSVSPEEDAMRVRHAVLIQKLALIYAVSEGAMAIEPRHLEPAILAVQWMWRHVRRLIPTWGATVEGQIEERILTVLRRRGSLPRRILQQQCRNPRKWGTVEFNRVLSALRENGVLEVDPAGTVSLVEYTPYSAEFDGVGRVGRQ